MQHRVVKQFDDGSVEMTCGFLFGVSVRRQQCHAHRGDERRREPDGLPRWAVSRCGHIWGLPHHRLAEGEIPRHGPPSQGLKSTLCVLCVFFKYIYIFKLNFQVRKQQKTKKIIGQQVNKVTWMWQCGSHSLVILTNQWNKNMKTWNQKHRTWRLTKLFSK